MTEAAKTADRPALSKRDARVIGEFLDQFEPGASVCEARVYAALVEGGPTSIARLANRLDIPFSTISRVLWALKLKKRVNYEPAPHDRRSKIVSAA